MLNEFKIVFKAFWFELEPREFFIFAVVEAHSQIVQQSLIELVLFQSKLQLVFWRSLANHERCDCLFEFSIDIKLERIIDIVLYAESIMLN